MEEFPSVYRLPIDDYLESEFLTSVFVNNGFVLSVSYPKLAPDPEYPDIDNVDYNTPHYMLLHVARPEVRFTHARTAPESSYQTVMLLADGTVVFGDHEAGRVFVYDYEFKKAGDFEMTGYAIDCTDDGILWTYERDSERLYQYDVHACKLLRQYTCDNIESVHRLTGYEGSRYRFACYGAEGDGLLTVDATTGEVTHAKRELYRARYFSDYVTTDGEHTWYLKSLRESGKVVSFRKGSDSEDISVLSGSVVVTVGGRYDETEPENAWASDSFAVYDLTGKQQYRFRNILRFRELTGSDYFGSPQLMNDSVVVFYGNSDEQTPGVFLWDFSKGEATPIENYIVSTNDSEGVVDSRIDAIYDTYGVRIRYKEYDLRTEIFDYRMLPITDDVELLTMIDSLENFLAMYPDGFWREIPGDGKTGVDFFVCAEFVRTGNNMIAEAAAVVNISWPSICMGVCSKYASQIKQTLVHETMHMMEHRISEFSDQQDLLDYLYWENELNTKRYPYYDAYTDENGDNISDYSGTYSDNLAEAWFIDAYSRSNWKEDRARIIENLYACNKYLFRNSPHLRAKADFLCAIIRAAFPSVAACKEPVLWEIPFGIVDPEPYIEKLKIIQ